MNSIEIRPDVPVVLSTLASVIETRRSSVDEFLRDPRSPGIIEFADWAATDNASALWQKVFSDSINGSGRHDYQFIFHLGDIEDKKVFELDEVLDIIGDYSSYGKVSMILDTREADVLWCRLNGRGADAIVSGPASVPAAVRYQFIFNTMRIDYLAVLQGSRVIHFSRDGQMQLASPTPVTILGIINARNRFSIGCQLGVLLGQDCPHSVALGLAVSGAWSGPVSAPDATALLDYMKEWQNRIN
jgi:hypothetical protein